MPSASLPTLEKHLEARLLKLDELHRTRPGLPTAMARAEAGRRIDDLLDAIAELQRMIDASPAEPLPQGHADREVRRCRICCT